VMVSTIAVFPEPTGPPTPIRTIFFFDIRMSNPVNS
jgi:hypothetical protein